LAGARVTYAIDLPFWWSALDPATGEPVAAVTYDGVRRSAAAHSLERLDSVTVMNYRNQTAGPDGLVAIATPVLVEAARVPGAVVRIGVETSRFRQSSAWFAIGPPAAQVGSTLGQTWRRTYPGDGFHLQTFDDGLRIHLGMTVSDADDGEPPPATLIDIAARFSPRLEGAGTDIAAALRAFDRNPEWRDARPAPIRDPRTGMEYAGVVAVHVPLPNLTFATRAEALEDEIRAAERAFRQFPAYRGLAVHHYDAFRDLAAPGRPDAERGP
jgi:hypothetical protein